MDRVEDEFAFLKDDTLDADLKKVLIEKVFEERNQKREAGLKASESQATQSLEKKRFWHNTPLVVALVGTITIAANALSSIFLKDADAGYEATKDERSFAFGIIEKELAKSNDTAARAGVLLFLVRAGILNSLNRAELEKMALNDLANAKIDPSTVGIPETVGAGRPTYDLELPPVSPDQTPAAQKLLEIATAEINQDIEENVSFETVKKYWGGVPGTDMSTIAPQTPWSGAFVSWAVHEAGNPDGLDLAPRHRTMWRSAAAKGITFAPGEKEVLPGDLIFVVYREEDVETFRTGQENMRGSASAGIVYSVTPDKLQYIGGNIGSAVRLRPVNSTDPKIAGFVRIGTGAASATVTGE